MKTSVLTIKMNLTINNKVAVLTRWRHLLEKLNELFSGTFKSDWEEKKGLDWQEWGKFPYLQ
jgi:hypothetical protein